MEREEIREIYDNVCKILANIDQLKETSSKDVADVIDDAYTTLNKVYNYFVEEFDF